MLLDKLNPIPSKMEQPFLLIQHICIDLQRLHINDQIGQIPTPKVDVLNIRWYVLPVPIVLTITQPESMSNYPIHYSNTEKKN